MSYSKSSFSFIFSLILSIIFALLSCFFIFIKYETFPVLQPVFDFIYSKSGIDPTIHGYALTNKILAVCPLMGCCNFFIVLFALSNDLTENGFVKFFFFMLSVIGGFLLYLYANNYIYSVVTAPDYTFANDQILTFLKFTQFTFVANFVIGNIIFWSVFKGRVFILVLLHLISFLPFISSLLSGLTLSIFILIFLFFILNKINNYLSERVSRGSETLTDFFNKL